jgi:hypothetical protein
MVMLSLRSTPHTALTPFVNLSRRFLLLLPSSHFLLTLALSPRCSADISVNVWQWNEKINSVAGYSAIAHSCRNFDKIKEWALDRRLHDWIDMDFYIPDDLEIPIIYS